MTALLLTVGDEILLGQVADTNAAWLGAHLPAAGVHVVRGETVGDTREAIVGALARSAERVVILTGGLGATSDDLTRDAVAAFTGRALTFRPALYDDLEAFYAWRGRPVPEDAARAMAHAPEGFEALPNPVGTAPGLWGDVTVDGRDVTLVLLPGVPREMRAIAEASVLPRLAARADEAVAWRTLLTVGVPETEVSAMLDGVVLPAGLSWAFLPSVGTVRVRVTGVGPDRAVVEAAVERAAEAARDALGAVVAGEGADTLESVVLDGLAARGWTLASAESCTGGALAAALTGVPGASRVFVGGIVAYGNPVKTVQLGVPEGMLEAHGAVSEPVVRAMAEGARAATGAAVGVAATGIAGPGGGTPEKPVGTVWIAVATPAGTTSRLLRLSPDRATNIARTVVAALDLVRTEGMRDGR